MMHCEAANLINIPSFFLLRSKGTKIGRQLSLKTNMVAPLDLLSYANLGLTELTLTDNSPCSWLIKTHRISLSENGKKGLEEEV